MPPEVVVLQDIGSLVDRYGLPLIMLLGGLWLVLSRRLVSGGELNYVEARRAEEREARIAAEATVKVLAEAVQQTADGLDGLTDVVVTAVEQALREDRERPVPRRRPTT